ncbi:MAG: ATP-dependent DNA ligase [Halobacteriales archaeon]
MEFEEFAGRADEIEALSGDHDKTAEVARLLVDAADDVSVVSRFVQGRVFPAWDTRKLNVGPALVYEALSFVTGASESEIEALVRDEGDVGSAAAELEFDAQRTLGAGPDSVSDVYRAFERLADEDGGGRQSQRVRAIADLLIDTDPRSAKYVVRLLLGEMRVGVGEGTVRDAVAEAFDVSVDLVERGFMLSNDVGYVADVARDEGEAGLRDIDMEVGRPVKPMLAQTGDASSVFDDLGRPVAVDWKYDGARVQVHVDGDGDVELYSRNLEVLTESLPEVVEAVEEDCASDVILDGEVVATEEGEPLAFQELLRRLRRKHDVREMAGRVSVDLHVFDVLYDGEAVVERPLERRETVLEEVAGSLAVERRYVETPEQVTSVESDALAAGHEGVMTKARDSAYTPGRRGRNWLKIKPEPETLDVVVTGGEWGEGRRTDLVGSYELSVRDGDELVGVGHVATGLTDERLEELTERFESLVVSEDGREIEFKPEVVFEVGYEEVQRSPQYDSGFALRFPRYLGVRDDLDVDDVDSVDRVERLYDSDG